MNAAWTVFVKELIDALRDRRTLVTVLLSSVAMGPMMLLVLSTMIGSMERRSEARNIVMVGAEHAPSLVNYLERQSLTIEAAPPDYAARLEASKFPDPVVVVPSDFEAQLAAGEVPVIEVVSNSTHQKASSSLRRVYRALQGFANEVGQSHLLARGVSPGLMDNVDIQERDLAPPNARAAQLTSMVPFFVIMAVLYGAMTAALDTTAGERERASLEPLLTNPASRASLVIGKWGAVVAVGLLIALLACVSFVPAQVFMKSETLQAMFRFGWREVAWFMAILLPLTLAVAALMMAIAIRAKTFKEAQSTTTVIIMAVSLLPLIQIFGQDGESRWHLLVPALGQVTLMNRVLRTEPFSAVEYLMPAGVALAVVALGVWYVARVLRNAAVR